MSSVEQKLVATLTDIIKDKYNITPEPGFVMVEMPKDATKGNYATNLAMRLTKLLRRRPQEIGQEIAEEIAARIPTVLPFTRYHDSLV